LIFYSFSLSHIFFLISSRQYITIITTTTTTTALIIMKYHPFFLLTLLTTTTTTTTTRCCWSFILHQNPSPTTNSRLRYKSGSIYHESDDGSGECYVSHDLLDHDYVVPSSTDRLKDNTSKTCSESTTGIHNAHRRCRWTGRPYGEQLIVKTSTNKQAMKREIDVIERIQQSSSSPVDTIVNIYDHNMKKSSQHPVVVEDDHHIQQEQQHPYYFGETNLYHMGLVPYVEEDEDAVIVMERGEQDLLAYLNTHYEPGWESTERFRHIVLSIVKSVDAIHNAGLVWTDIKLSNFVVMNSHNQNNNNNNNRNQYPTVKAIDLESCVTPGSRPTKFTASTSPPEMASVLLYYVVQQDGEVPSLTMQYSYDVWSLGIVLFTLMTRRPYHHTTNTDFGCIARSLGTIRQEDVDYDPRLAEVNPTARDFVWRCLRIHPDERPTVHQLLQHPYLTSNQNNNSNNNSDRYRPYERQGLQ
jgi:serine/threonine protein kinase